jgi:phosphopantetheinyl transferase (holo-ACP synthase)
MSDDATFANEPLPDRRIYLSVSPAGPRELQALQKQLEALTDESHRRGVRIDVRSDILESWLRPSIRQQDRESAEARASLAEAWERALEAEPQALGMSLSHTHGLAVAAVQAAGKSPPGRASIGVDVEWRDRPIDARISERIGHEDDECESCPPIVLWCAKEALLKSDLCSQGKSLRQYAVILAPASEGVYLGSGTGAGEFSKSLSVQIVDGLVLAIAS